MNNKQLEYALELSKNLSFSITAEVFGISQPALSKQISKLEKELGVELFNRKTNPVSLTAAGEHFFQETKVLLYRQEQLCRSMQDFKTGFKGKLVIGISPFRSLYLIPEICKKVKEKYPDIKIILHEDTSDQLRKMALEGKFDFAIVNLPVDESVLDVELIEQDTLVLAVPESMVSEIKYTEGSFLPKINFKDCSKLPFVVVGKSQEMRQLFEKICSYAEIIPNISIEVVGLATAWTMVRNGLGATLLPLQFVKSMKPDNNIKLFIPECEMNIRQPAVITRHGQFMPDYTKYAISLLTGSST